MKSLREIILNLLLVIGYAIMALFGVYLFRHTEVGLRIMQLWVSVIFAVRAAIALFAILGGKNQKNMSYILRLIFNIIMFAITFGNEYIGAFSIALAIGLVLILDGLVKLACSYIYKKSELKNWWQEGFFGIASIVLGIVLISPNGLTVGNFIKIIAIYIIVLSIVDLVGYLFQGESWRNVKKRWKFHALNIHKNVLKNSSLPANWFESIEKEIEAQNDLSRFLEREKIEKDVPMVGYQTFTLLIHSWDEKRETMKGHADIIIDNKAYSFGNYDTSSHHIFGAVADGCLVVAEEKAYYEYCLDVEGKVLLTYKLRVTDEQHTKAIEFIDEMKSATQLWRPTSEQIEAENAGVKIMNKINAVIYKFKKTQFKYYFVLDTNCVRFVEQILKAINFDEANIHGIVTPGDYIDFFEKKVNNPKDETVISREVLIPDKLKASSKMSV